MVTGGTDGIGKAYTFELARRGLRKFVLIGRNEKKLEDVKIQLGTHFKVETTRKAFSKGPSKNYTLESEFEGLRVNTFKLDFETDDFKELREFLADIDVGFAVNSVGVGREFLERFGDRPEADSQILKVNALGAAEVRTCQGSLKIGKSSRLIWGLHVSDRAGQIVGLMLVLGGGIC